MKSQGHTASQADEAVCGHGRTEYGQCQGSEGVSQAGVQGAGPPGRTGAGARVAQVDKGGWRARLE